MILGHPFLDTDRALIDVKERQLILKVQDDKSLSICHQASLPILYSCFQVDAIVYKVVVSLHGFSKDLLETCIAQSLITEERYFEVEHMVIIWGTHHYKKVQYFEDFKKSSSPPLSSLQQVPNLK